MDLLAHWALIEADLHERFGVDVEDRQLMRSRSWRWLQTRIVGLLSVESRLHRVLNLENNHEQGDPPDGAEAG